VIFQLADGKVHSIGKILAQVGVSERYFRDTTVKIWAALPWLTMHRHENGIRFEIDENLRQICARARPLPDLNGISIDAFIDELLEMIARVRDENKCRRDKQNWNTDHTIKIELVRLIDQIEDRLRAIPKTTTRGGQQKSGSSPNRLNGNEATEHSNVNRNEISTPATFN
jgi:hypothetical protein